MITQYVTREDQDKQNAEILRLPIGARVKVHGALGMGVGTVTAHITEIVAANRPGLQVSKPAIPLRGWVQVEVFFPDDFDGIHDRFNSRELVRV